MRNIVHLTILLCVLMGNALCQIFPRGQTIIAGEYFLNTDPGVGLGISISAQYGTPEVTISLNLQVTEGNVVYLRFRSSNGIWGPAQSLRYALPLPNSGSILVAAEYFVNTDPGVGNASFVPIAPTGEINIGSVAVTKGDRIYLRAKDSFGRWSAGTAGRFDYKRIRAAQLYLRYRNGDSSAVMNMNVEPHSDSTALYVTTRTVPDTTIGGGIRAAIVRYQSEDFLWSDWVSSSSLVNVIDVGRNVPGVFALEQNYPNPFNPITIINFQLPIVNFVTLKIYDILGREVTTLVSEKLSPGTYNAEWNASGFASGVYFYRLQAGDFVETKKLLLLR